MGSRKEAIKKDFTVWKGSGLILIIIGVCLTFYSEASPAGKAFCVAAYSAAAVFSLTPVSRDRGKIIQRVLFAVSPLASYFILEIFTGVGTGNAAAKLFSVTGAVNIFILVLVLWMWYVILNKIKSAAVCEIAFAFTLGGVDYILIMFRDSPLLAHDIASAVTAAGVASNYSLVLSASAAYCMTFAIIYLAVLASMHGYRSIDRRRRLACCGLFLCGALMLAGVMTGTNAIGKTEISGIDITGSFKKNGTALSFAMSVRDAKVEKPEGYSVAAAKEAAEGYRSDSAGTGLTVSEEHPNVIVVMDESYADLSYLGQFDTAQDYAPFYRSLSENTIKGTLHTSVFGGNTANTEYEFLTGNSLAFMPLHMVPFNYKAKDGTPSVARTLAAQGYGGDIAFHPGRESSYNRNDIYPAYGFKKAMFLDDAASSEMLRAYLSDRSDFETIMSEYEKYRSGGASDPFFMYNITIQNHSDYNDANGRVSGADYLSGDLSGCESTEQYLKLVRKTDDALKDLITYYEKTDEPTVIIFFGDHQPMVDEKFYDEVLGNTDGNIEKEELKYRVPFMIWANYDIQEESGVQISANYLGSYLLDKIGARMTGYDKYLLDLYRKVPVITSVCYMGDDGKIRERGEKSKYSQYLREYQILQYNNTVDAENRIGGFFRLRE
ncbi:MAG: LTA synthase family protein [Anaerovoracaceae bacterium]|jgi:hypothetical protein